MSCMAFGLMGPCRASGANAVGFPTPADFSRFAAAGVGHERLFDDDIDEIDSVFYAPAKKLARGELSGQRESKLGCFLADLRLGARQKSGNMGDGAAMLDPVAQREQLLLRPLSAAAEIGLFGQAIHPNSRALSLASV